MMAEEGRYSAGGRAEGLRVEVMGQGGRMREGAVAEPCLKSE